MIDIQELKQYILENQQIEPILESLGCHHIKHKNGFFQCGNPDGDNQTAISVYENENLTTIDYTRDIAKAGHGADIISLVQFFKNISFPLTIKDICEEVGLDYYHDFTADLPESIRMTKMLLAMTNDLATEDDEHRPLKPITETILNYYPIRVNDMFLKDNISYETQNIFEIGYDDFTNRITIPIRDELGNLVGVKGRLFGSPGSNDLKYLYLEPCARAKVLYGLFQSYSSIQEKHAVYVGEAEKSVLQMWSMGYTNCVATGGKKVSRQQIDMLTRLCVDIVFLFDKDVQPDELTHLSESFIDGVSVYAAIDDKGILSDKQAPSDDPEKFKQLLSTCIKRLK